MYHRTSTALSWLVAAAILEQRVYRRQELQSYMLSTVVVFVVGIQHRLPFFVKPQKIPGNIAINWHASEILD